MKLSPIVAAIPLPKWSGMIVEGDNVSPELAAEILVKTDSNLPDFCWAGNDPQLRQELNAIFSVPSTQDFKGEDYQQHYKRLDTLSRELGCLKLNYLSNERIVSSWVGGPHGWINWDGTIGCRSYNIGKWPSVEEVFNDWETIAKAFPALKLSCWLHSGETCEPESVPIVRFDVEGGSVTAQAHNPDRAPTGSFVEFKDTLSYFSALDREMGITPTELAEHVRKIYDHIPQFGRPQLPE